MRRSKALCDDEILELPDCVSLTEKGGCTRLNISRCLGAKCTFMNHSGDIGSSDAWKRRLTNLSEEEQLKISRKYYGGAEAHEQGICLCAGHKGRGRERLYRKAAEP